ncbi:hypothetical protein [Streptomyces sp. Da 82-17]|uniref:hypothetical protein n=1 Tax=Streptomyces sp. Da 82-17 TaxID=3377116 RepID=UPI0038D434EC
MITVIRTRLDNGSTAAVRADGGGLTIAMDDRHITETGARSLQRALGSLIERAEQQIEPAPEAN